MGRRGANQTAVLFAALGTIACGVSPSMNFLIAARFVSVKYVLHLVSDLKVTARWNRWWGDLYDFDVCLTLYLYT